MNAAAWIALGGAVLVVLTNVVVITRFLSNLEMKFLEYRALNKGELDVIRAEFKALVESTNVQIGRIVVDHSRLERRSDIRISDLERVVGRSANLRDLDD